MNKKSWTEFRSDIEKVIKEFNLSGELKSVNITQTDNIDKRFMTAFLKSEKQNKSFSGWIWESLKDNNQWGRHSPDYEKTTKILLYTAQDTNEDLYIIFTESYREKTKFWYYEGKIRAMTTIIEETPGIDEFYIFSKKFTWIIGQNHHDVIFAAGIEKAERLKKGFEIYQ